MGQAAILEKLTGAFLRRFETFPPPSLSGVERVSLRKENSPPPPSPLASSLNSASLFQRPPLPAVHSPRLFDGRAARGRRRDPGLRHGAAAGAFFPVFFVFFFSASSSLFLSEKEKNSEKKLQQQQPEGETNPLKFSQAFVLAPLGGSWAVTNDIFRLNYA